MIRINLLPYRTARSKENIRRQVSVFCLSIVLLLIVLWVFNGFLNSRVERFSERLADLQKEVKRYEQKAHQVEEIKKKLNELNKKIKIVNKLKTYRKLPPQLLAEMTKTVVTDRMQLTMLESKGNTLNLQGLALDNETIAAFMTRLERSPLFGSVSLKSAKQVKQFNIDMKDFQITCKKTTAQQSAQNKAEKK